MIIGITGKSGSGKSTISEELSKKTGFYHIDIDIIGHEEIYCQQDIINILHDMFGDEIFDNSRKPIKRKIGELFFAERHNPRIEEFSDITWRLMKESIEKKIKVHNNVILNWILLPHTRFFKICDLKYLIFSDDNLRRNKVMLRDNISREYFEARESASIPYDNYDFTKKFYNKYFNGDISGIVSHIIDDINKEG